MLTRFLRYLYHELAFRHAPGAKGLLRLLRNRKALRHKSRAPRSPRWFFFASALIAIRISAVVLIPFFAWCRAKLGVRRSLWGVTPILTLPLLARCDRLLGHAAETLVLARYHITDAFDWDLSTQQRWIVGKFPDCYPLWAECVFLFALMRFDVFHYFYDRGIMKPAARFGINHRELALLRRYRKQLFTYAYGADVRTREATLATGDWNFCRDCDDPGRYCICNTEELAESMRPVIPVAKAMNAMGDMLIYVPSPNHFNYWPVDTSCFKPFQPRNRAPGARLVLAHAPNHEHFKGTKYLLQAIENLQRKGLALELRRAQHVPNEQVLALFEEVDVVVDQLVGGFFGYTALEAMAVGRPVITYVRSLDLLLPGFPLLNATPDNIEDILEDLYHGKYDLDAVGAAGQAYVADQHSLYSVANRLKRLYEF